MFRPYVEDGDVVIRARQSRRSEDTREIAESAECSDGRGYRGLLVTGWS
jgi:uncharacterized protein (DUF2249 family)